MCAWHSKYKNVQKRENRPFEMPFSAFIDVGIKANVDIILNAGLVTRSPALYERVFLSTVDVICFPMVFSAHLFS